MSHQVLVRVLGAADGSKTPHDGRYVESWNPHTMAGVLDLDSTADKSRAKRFDSREVFTEWRTVSNVQPERPWDGRPNRPLTGLNIDIFKAED